MEKNKQRVFGDSNFFVALLNPFDSLHEKALQASLRMKEELCQLIITNLIFLEIVTILSQRVSRRVSITFGTHILQDNQIEIIHVDEELQKRSWEIFQTTDKKNVSFVDCSILATMKFNNVHTLLTFDREDFQQLLKEHKFSLFRY